MYRGKNGGELGGRKRAPQSGQGHRHHLWNCCLAPRILEGCRRSPGPGLARAGPGPTAAFLPQCDCSRAKATSRGGRAGHSHLRHHRGLRRQGLWVLSVKGASAPARLLLASPRWGRGLVERQAVASDPLWRAAAVSLSRCFQRFEMQPLFLKSTFLLLCSYCTFHLQPFPSLFSL